MKGKQFEKSDQTAEPEQPVQESEPKIEYPAYVPQPEPEWTTVIPIEYFAVRSAPAATAPVLLYVTRGKPVQVQKSGKPWLKIKHPKLGDKIGYVSATILDSIQGKPA